MRRILLILGLCLLMLLTASGVYAEETEPAFVVHGDTCWIPDANYVMHEIKDCCTMVIANSVTGVRQFTCHAQLPDYAAIPDKAVLYTYKDTGYKCFWDFEGPFTTNYIFTVTPSGEVSLSCRFTPGTVSWEP
jgi:hypothetical protein